MQESQEMQVRSLDWEDLLEEGMATHSSILAWRIHGQRSLVGYSPRISKSQTWLSDFARTHTHTHTHTHTQEAGSLRMESVPSQEEISETCCLSVPRGDGSRR